MARLTTTEQDAVLASADRSTYVRVKIEDPNGTMVDVGTLYGENFLNEVVMEHTTDAPIGRCTVSLWRKSGIYSIAPLLETSPVNRDAGANYAPFVNPHRAITVETATLFRYQPVVEADYEKLFSGFIDEVEWGGFTSRVVLHCRDELADLNDKIIEDVTEYGSDTTLPDIESVAQDILDDNDTGITLAVPVSPNFGLYAYELGRVSVLDALKALANLVGWNLHLRWSDIAGALQLTLWEPNRDATATDWTIGPDDYYDVRTLNLNVAGIRNKIEVIYTDVDGVDQTKSATDVTSIAYYGTRFMRIDARGTSISTVTQASTLASNLLSDLSTPDAVQEIESAFWWPLELGDMVTYEANGEHYDTNQTWATFAYRHVLTPDRCRTFISARGKPSGGYARWHGVERAAQQVRRAGPSIQVTFDANGNAVVSCAGDSNTANIYVTVGDGAYPAPPTPQVYDGRIEGQQGTVSTDVKVTTGNDAYVRAVSADVDGNLSTVTSVKMARRLGPLHKNTTDREHTGNTTQTTLQTITVPANKLGLNGGFNLRLFLEGIGGAGTKTVRIKLNTELVATITLPATSGVFAHVDLMIANESATDSQDVSGCVVYSNNVTGTIEGKGKQDTTADMNVVITGQLASSADRIQLTRSWLTYIGTD